MFQKPLLEVWLTFNQIVQHLKVAFVIVDLSRCPTCPLVFGCWELSHVIFFKLRKKELLSKLRKFTK